MFPILYFADPNGTVAGVAAGIEPPPMITSRGGNEFHRLVDVLSPPDGIVAVMYEGYFDESGDLESEPVFCLAGYYIDSDRAKEMDEKWRIALYKYRVPYFHMVDCAHGSGVFSSVSLDDRIAMVKELIGLIKEYTIEGFATVHQEQPFAPTADYPNVYSFGVYACLTSLQSFLQANRIDGKIAYFFETGHRHRNNAYRLVGESVKKLGSAIAFVPKEQVRLLQAADLLAWQVTKYMKDKISGARPPRKDFLSLMEHPHSLAHARTDEDGQAVIGFEMWPLSRRSPSTVAFSLNYDGPITLMHEEGDKTPLIPVMRTLGWRPASGGSLVYVGFRQLGPVSKDFALAFDEPTLFEAMGMFLDAPAAFPKTESQVLLRQKKLEVQTTAIGVLVTLHLAHGARVAFRVEPEDAKALAKMLSATTGGG